MEEDLYALLGLNKNATSEEIKTEYRKLAKMYHPDKNNGDKEKEEKFKKINLSYSILGDETKKQSYDNQSPHGKTYNPNPFSAFTGGGADDIFNAFFGGGNPFGTPFGGNPFGARHEYREFHENLDITINVMVTLSDVYKANPIKVNYKRFEHCPDCQGTGFNRNGHSDNCEMCGGNINQKGSGRDQYGRKCEYCQGHGVIFSETCQNCNGEKVVLKDFEFNINNIQSVRNSNEKYLPNFGHQSKYYREKKGTLKLNIIFQNVPNHNIENEQLIYKLNLHFDDAIKGMKYEYECLDGNKLIVDIPEKTNDGDVLRIQGKGLFKNLNERDDLFFRINVMIDYERLQLGN